MKRNEKKVPGFDEIIFANRNKKYGAYDLRRRYKTVTSLSAIGTTVIFAGIVLAISLKTEPVAGNKGPEVLVILQPETYKPPQVEQPEIIPPANMVKPQNIAPKVVDDTMTINTDLLPINDDLVKNTINGDPNDTLVDVAVPATDYIPVPEEVFIVVEEMPAFPGGDAALLGYIAKNTVYPEEAIQNNIEGRVTLKFVVTPDGSVGKIEVLQGVDPLLDQEAMRVVKTLPAFKPGKQAGKPVSVWFQVPVLFRITR